MTRWLASVQSVAEAQTLLANLPDILDMKDPLQGALGALSVGEVSTIVDLVAGSCQTSATVGDLPMEAELIIEAIRNMASSGVDYVKVGLFPDRLLAECLMEMSQMIGQLNVPVIAVLFADKMPEKDVLPLLKSSGFSGVMVDTASKNGQHLLEHWDELRLSDFVETAREYDLLCGLAGALRFEDIAALQAIGADYLGFRSALCQHRQRTSVLEPYLAEQIHNAIHS